jgi:hypothetical protein
MQDYLDKWIPANKLSKNEHLKAPDGATVTVVGGTTPKVHDGWMWDLTVPGNNDHDFYIDTIAAAILVHNECSSTSGNNSRAALGKEAHNAFSDMLNEEGNGYSGAQGVGNGLRVDGVYDDPAQGPVPLELKPDTATQLVRGWNQLSGYEQAMGSPSGSGQLWTWMQDQAGNFIFRRAL